MNTKKTLKALHFVYTQSLALLLIISFSNPLFSQNTDLDQILASDGGEFDWFGNSIRLSEDYLVVGAPDLSVLGAENNASVYVYSKDNNNNWGNEQMISYPNDGFNWFGFSVSLSGNTIVTGDISDNEQANNAGAAYVYEVDGNGQWNFKQKLVPNDAIPSLFFGNTVYVSQDYIAVQSLGLIFSDLDGFVYMFKKDNAGNWNFTQKIEPNTEITSYRFGSSISMYGDYLVIGNKTYSEEILLQGAVHIYKKDSNGIWSNETILTAPDGMEQDYFGESVSLYENTLIVGAPYTDDFGENSGSVYVYELDGNGNWNMEQKILASDEQESATFGYSVQIHDNKFIVGALSHDGLYTNAGAAYTYTRTDNSEWVAEEIYYAFDASPEQSFGHDVCINSNTIAISANNHDGNGENAGAVYISGVDCSFSLECPEDLIIETNTGTCEGLAVFDEATLIPEVIDGCGGISISQINGPANNEPLEVGIYEVSFEAVSAEGITDNCTFSIEVVDNEAPVALCQDLAFVLNPCAELSIQAEEVDFGSSDACGIASYNLSQTFFDESFIGTNPVELAVTDIHGNTATCNASIAIEAGIQIDASTLISPENITVTYGEPLELSPSIANMDELIFSWYVDGALYCTDCYSISIYPETNAVFELIVEDIEGCFRLSDAVALQLLVDYSVHIPSAFSPNYDGVNDLFQAYFSDGVERAYELQVRDRWGNIVFHQKGDNIAWDGSFRGQEAITGIYNYTMVFSLVNETEIVETGDVYLMR
jgi:gliding motility-associated-like protein